MKAKILNKVKKANTYKKGIIFFSYSFRRPIMSMTAVTNTATEATKENNANTINVFLTEKKKM